MAVATDRARVSDKDLFQFLEWLDEQRQREHDRLEQLARVVEEQRTELRDQGAAIAVLRAANGSKSGADTRPLDGGPPQRLAEQLVLVERALYEHIENQSRAAQADAALRDRERRTITELSQQAELLNRANETLTSRVQALTEEIRHERDARAPFFQALDDLGRSQSSIQNRVLSLDQILRRATNAQTVLEQTSEKQSADLARLDNQIKLQDLRFSRELIDIRKLVDEWRTRSDEQLKPVESVARQLTQLADQRDVVIAQVAALDQALSDLATEFNCLAATAKVDRSATDHVNEALEAHLRRWEATGGSIWQLGERLTAIVDDLAALRGSERALREEVQGVVGRLDRFDDDNRRLEGALGETNSAIRAVDREAQSRSAALDVRIDAELASVTERANARYRLAIEHLQRIVGELQHQQQELELGAS
jgi:uncharacterized protein YoxC